ncbi:patatin-like phospholipase family protein [Alphaproteobacteria bacterium]|nr:patatin-like phospholipase family protein [Alphaproteobacteria bacterium]
MSHKKERIVLFNYGGGMRGLVPAHLMASIEEKTGLQMADMVDVFTGPSTGAILNAALNVPSQEKPARPKFRAKHMVKFYEREGLKIFPPDRFRDFRSFIHDFNNRTMKIGQLRSLMSHGHYDPAYLAKCLRDMYGNHTLSDSLQNIVIPVYNLDGRSLQILQEEGETEDAPAHTKNNIVDQGGHALWFKKMNIGQNSEPTPKVSLTDVVLASCAAPTYFPCHHFKSAKAEYSGIDGSIFDNPCITYHGAIRQHVAPEEKVTMIMLGTGHTLRSFDKDHWNKLGGLGIVDPVNDLPLINILFHASETALIDSFSADLGDNKYVFNKSLITAINETEAPSTQIDDASPENLKKLEHFAMSIIEENQKDFDKICNILVRNHERRSAKPKERKWFSFLKSA